MLLAIELPRLHDLMTTAVVTAVHAVPGATLESGAPLFDIRIDLSHAAAHDCPPVSWFRVILRDRGVLRALTVAEDSEVAAGERVGLVASAPDESTSGEPARAARLTAVGLVGPDPEW